MDNRSIGFFDSGIGGLTTLAECAKILPNENFIFFADNKNSPFGEKSHKKILEITKNGIEFLVNKKVKAVVLACNTATKISALSLRREFDIDIIGIEPAIKQAYIKGGRTLVLTTRATAECYEFKKLLNLYGKNAILAPQNELATVIENMTNFDECEKIIKKMHLFGADNIVLGCTHYVFMKKYLAKLHPNINIFDGNVGVAKNLYNTLKSKNMLANYQKPVIHMHVTMGKTEKYKKILKNLLKRDTKP